MSESDESWCKRQVQERLDAETRNQHQQVSEAIDKATGSRGSIYLWNQLDMVEIDYWHRKGLRLTYVDYRVDEDACYGANSSQYEYKFEFQPASP